MANLLLLTALGQNSQDVLPSLGLLTHQVRVAAPEPAVLLAAADADAVLVDGRLDLAGARNTCRMLHAGGLEIPIILVLTEGGMMVVTSQWGVADLILTTAGPAEVEARIRLVREHELQTVPGSQSEELVISDLVIDPTAYTVRLRGQHLDLTYKEFELLKFIVAHPQRVFTRDQLLQEVWGYDYYGGTRTVDVHVRRLRAKLGTEYEQMISTVRNVGYRFDPPKDKRGVSSVKTKPTSTELNTANAGKTADSGPDAETSN